MLYDVLKLYYNSKNIYENFILPNKEQKTDKLANSHPDIIPSSVPSRSIPTPETSNIYENYGNAEGNPENVYANGGIVAQ